MKILVPGRKEEKEKRFECSACGCVFEAEKKDFVGCIQEYTIVPLSVKSFPVCECPYCKNKVATDDAHIEFVKGYGWRRKEGWVK